MYVTKEQIRQARCVNLADYLLCRHSSIIRSAGSSIYLKTNRSLYIKKSVPGYHDFSTGEHGNSIDFLTRQLNYSFTEAVTALCRFDSSSRSRTELPDHPFCLPEKAASPYHKVNAYLISRGIPADTILFLIKEELLYQDMPNGNAVFLSYGKDYCEIRGTGDYPFHGCRKMKADLFWHILSGPHPECAYICEAAIDAVSLLLIHRRNGMNQPAAYISIGGVANQKTIDRIKKEIRSVLAVDNDAAGHACRERNPDLLSLIPQCKDWNEDLIDMNRR